MAMFTIIRDLIRYNIEFAIGLAILLLLIGAVILSFFSPYPAADIYVVPPDMPPDVPALKVFYLYLSAGCNLHCRHCWITPTFVHGKPVPAECLDFDLLKSAVAEAKRLARALGPRIDASVIEHSIDRLIAMWEGDEAPEGIAAFFEKRKPRWQS